MNHKTETKASTAVTKATSATIQVQTGNGAIEPAWWCLSASPGSGYESSGGWLYPHTGQPLANLVVEPEKPQRGHRTAEKNRPQVGQDLSSRPTSAPQCSQKNLGDFWRFRISPWRRSCRLRWKRVRLPSPRMRLREPSSAPAHRMKHRN